MPCCLCELTPAWMSFLSMRWDMTSSLLIFSSIKSTAKPSPQKHSNTILSGEIITMIRNFFGELKRNKQSPDRFFLSSKIRVFKMVFSQRWCGSFHLLFPFYIGHECWETKAHINSRPERTINLKAPGTNGGTNCMLELENGKCTQWWWNYGVQQ